METRFTIGELPGGAPCATVEGEIDIESAPALREVLDELARRTRHVIVSLERCSYLDSSALNVLVAAQKASAERDDGRCVLVIPKRNRIRRVLAVSGLDEKFAVVDSLDAAAALLAG